MEPSERLTPNTLSIACLDPPERPMLIKLPHLEVNPVNLLATTPLRRNFQAAHRG